MPRLKKHSEPVPTVELGGVRYLTIAEYAAWKRLNYFTVRKEILRGNIPHERIGNRLRIPVRVAASERPAA